MSKKRRTSDTEPQSAKASPQILISLDPRAVQRTMNQIVKNLNDPEYREQLTKLTQAAVTNSLQTLRKLNQFSTQVSQLDNKGLENLIDGSIDDLMRAYLQFNSDLLVLLQRLSGRTVEILDNASCQKAAKGSSQNKKP